MNAASGLRAAWLAVIAVCVASELDGQSLGDVARKGKERRASQGQACPPRVITNEDLLRDHVEAPAPSGPTTGSAASPVASPASPATTVPSRPTALELAERDWRERASDLRRVVKSAEQRIAYMRGST